NLSLLARPGYRWDSHNGTRRIYLRPLPTSVDEIPHQRFMALDYSADFTSFETTNFLRKVEGFVPAVIRGSGPRINEYSSFPIAVEDKVYIVRRYIQGGMVEIDIAMGDRK